VQGAGEASPAAPAYAGARVSVLGLGGVFWFTTADDPRLARSAASGRFALDLNIRDAGGQVGSISSGGTLDPSGHWYGSASFDAPDPSAGRGSMTFGAFGTMSKLSTGSGRCRRRTSQVGGGHHGLSPQPWMRTAGFNRVGSFFPTATATPATPEQLPSSWLGWGDRGVGAETGLPSRCGLELTQHRSACGAGATRD
jgi:hypothetical protein